MGLPPYDIVFTQRPVAASVTDEAGDLHGIIGVRSRPNPFESSTTITLSVPDSEALTAHLTVFDARGRRVDTLALVRRSAGTYSATWDGKDRLGKPVSPGVYFFRADSCPRAPAGKLVFVR